MNVLLVEDEKKIADFVCAGFCEQGFNFDYSDNGNDGFTKASQGQYDVIVLDIMLPGRDGLSILKSLRKSGNVRIPSNPRILPPRLRRSLGP